ncbi:MAG TPA: helix-turn-helix domain-containing protein [Puia sp.]|nr:helix-turn-helix domain-containing protein [Puia sp.]
MAEPMLIVTVNGIVDTLAKTGVKYKRKLIGGGKKDKATEQEYYRKLLIPVRDALEVVYGRWKLPIIISLSLGAKRFSELSKDIQGMTDKMLSKELKALELNRIISRTIHNTFPPTVEYTITEHGVSLHKLIASLGEWGMVHRRTILGKNRLT